jgi:2-C-methyl-D-erythritol 4-phosphate cytidylyltransferase
MGGDLPKQYLQLHGRSVLEWALQPFLLDSRCRAAIVALAPDDAHWPKLKLQHRKLLLTTGGVERADTVLAALEFLSIDLQADANDWVLVHDAARPCLHVDDLDALLNVTATDESVGALLATPLVDTLSGTDDLRVAVRYRAPDCGAPRHPRCSPDYCAMPCNVREQSAPSLMKHRVEALACSHA